MPEILMNTAHIILRRIININELNIVWIFPNVVFSHFFKYEAIEQQT